MIYNVHIEAAWLAVCVAYHFWHLTLYKANQNFAYNNYHLFNGSVSREPICYLLLNF